MGSRFIQAVLMIRYHCGSACRRPSERRWGTPSGTTHSQKKKLGAYPPLPPPARVAPHSCPALRGQGTLCGIMQVLEVGWGQLIQTLLTSSGSPRVGGGHGQCCPEGLTDDSSGSRTAPCGTQRATPRLPSVQFHAFGCVAVAAWLSSLSLSFFVVIHTHPQGCHEN